MQNTVNSAAFRTSFVQTVYGKLLGRAATAGEAAPLATQLQSGGKAWQTVIVTVAGSPAYFKKVGNSNTPFVNSLFGDLVGRAPDAGEEVPAALDFLKGGGSRSELAAVVADTDEFRTNWTQIYYQKLLERAATDAEATAGAAKLNTGGIAALVTSLLSSPAYFQKGGGTQSGWQNTVNLTLLSTTPDEGGGMGDTTGTGTGAGETMGDGGTTTTTDYPVTTTSTSTLPMNNSRAPMVQALLASPEYLANVVQGYYQKFLRRSATPAELQQWSAELQGGGSPDQVLMSVLTCDEYFNRAGGTTTGYLNHLSQDLLGKSGKSIGIGNVPSTNDLLDMLRNLPRKKNK